MADEIETGRADAGEGEECASASAGKCADCGAALNEGEAKTFTCCDACWDKTYRRAPAAPTDGDEALARAKDDELAKVYSEGYSKGWRLPVRSSHHAGLRAVRDAVAAEFAQRREQMQRAADGLRQALEDEHALRRDAEAEAARLRDAVAAEKDAEIARLRESNHALASDRDRLDSLIKNELEYVQKKYCVITECRDPKHFHSKPVQYAIRKLGETRDELRQRAEAAEAALAEARREPVRELELRVRAEAEVARLRAELDALRQGVGSLPEMLPCAHCGGAIFLDGCFEEAATRKLRESNELRCSVAWKPPCTD